MLPSLLLLLLAIALPAGDARLFRLYCPIEEETVVQVYRDGDKFYFAPGDENGDSSSTNNAGANNVRRRQNVLEENWNTQFLRGGRNEDIISSSTTSALTIEASRRQTQDVSTLETVSVRKCSCAWGRHYEGTDYYCTLPWTHCGIPSAHWNENIVPACVNATKSNKTAKLLWYPIVVIYSLLVLCCLCTQAGRGVPNYAFGKVVPYWNRHQVNRIIEHDPGRRNMLIRRYCERRRREMQRQAEQEGRVEGSRADDNDASPAQDVPRQEEGGQGEEEEQLPPPLFLALRTRRYDASKETRVLEHTAEHDSDLGDEATCTICFGPLTDGCRVGALPCDHIFHVECLKIWLKRRNVCPLCQARHVAEPRYDKPETPTEGESSTTAGEHDADSGRRDELGVDSEAFSETPRSTQDDEPPYDRAEPTTNATEQLPSGPGRTVLTVASSLSPRGSSHHEHAE